MVIKVPGNRFQGQTMAHNPTRPVIVTAECTYESVSE